MRSTPFRPRSVGLPLLLAVIVALFAGACSSEASTRAAAADDGPTTTAAPVTTAATIPEGTTLRVGDQLDYLKTVLALAGEDEDFDYEVEYAAFIGGPPMLQAFQGGSLDTGFVGSTPLIFAQAAGQELLAVAGWASENSAYGLLTSDPSIEGWGDLSGKRVAYQRGTAAEAVLLQELDKAGIDPSEITTVDVPLPGTGAALKGGSADAGISVEPLTSLYLSENPGGGVVAGASSVTDRSSFILATTEALGDSGRSAALADYITRVVRAFSYLAEHPDLIAQSVYAEQYGLSPERATEIQAANGPISFLSLPDDIVDAQQHLADLFVAAGQIPAEIDVSAQFDTRFNELVQATQDGTR